MRGRVVALALVTSSGAAAEEAPQIIRVRRLEQTSAEPVLHLTPLLRDPLTAAGGLSEQQATAVELGRRVRLSGQGSWWQTGMAPSHFASDLREHGWRASGELSLDLGWFRVGVNASRSNSPDGRIRTVGLFVSRSARLSRWMEAFIMVGVGEEVWTNPATNADVRSTTLGLTLGTTFR